MTVEHGFFRTSYYTENSKLNVADPANRIRAAFSSLNSNSPPSHIDLSYSNLQINTLKVLVQYLTFNDTVKVVNLKGNCIGDKGAILIASVLEQNRSIRRLNLSRNALGAPGVIRLAAAASINSSLTNLDLSYNGISEEGIQAISELISNQHCQLRWLNLKHNAIGDNGVAALGHGLQSNQSLLLLNIADNQIGPKGTRSLCNALANNSSLSMLDLSRNQLGIWGAGHIANILSRTELQAILLSGNKIDDEGALALIFQLSKSTAMEYIDLRDNPITQEALGLWKEKSSKTMILYDEVRNSTCISEQHSIASSRYQLHSSDNFHESADEMDTINLYEDELYRTTGRRRDFLADYQ